jgi:hypothetical protein
METIMALKPIHYVGIGVGVIGALALYTVVAKADKATVFGKPWTSSIVDRLQAYSSSVTPQDVTDAAESPLGVFQGTKGYAYNNSSANIVRAGTIPMKDLIPMLAEKGLVAHIDAKYKDTSIPLGSSVTMWITKLGDAAPVDGFIVLR